MRTISYDASGSVHGEVPPPPLRAPPSIDQSTGIRDILFESDSEENQTAPADTKAVVFLHGTSSEYRVGWVHDSESTTCMWCDQSFTRLKRRHHCRACGALVCQDCSGRQLPIKGLKPGLHRVCDHCYDNYQLEEEEADAQVVYETEELWKKQEQLRRKKQEQAWLKAQQTGLKEEEAAATADFHQRQSPPKPPPRSPAKHPALASVFPKIDGAEGGAAWDTRAREIEDQQQHHHHPGATNGTPEQPLLVEVPVPEEDEELEEDSPSQNPGQEPGQDPGQDGSSSSPTNAPTDRGRARKQRRSSQIVVSATEEGEGTDAEKEEYIINSVSAAVVDFILLELITEVEVEQELEEELRKADEEEPGGLPDMTRQTVAGNLSSPEASWSKSFIPGRGFDAETLALFFGPDYKPENLSDEPTTVLQDARPRASVVYTAAVNDLLVQQAKSRRRGTF